MKILVFAVAVLASSLMADNIKIELSNEPEEFRKSILKIIDIGSDINRAKKVMEGNGFKCSFIKNSTFSDGKNLHRHIDFLYCDLEKGFITGRRWQAAVVYKNNTVENVLVSTGLTGP